MRNPKAKGTALPCIMTDILEGKIGDNGEIKDEYLIAGALGTMYTGKFTLQYIEDTTLINPRWIIYCAVL